MKEREKIRRFGGESSTWSVFEANQRSKKSLLLGLALEWRFEKGDRKSYNAAQNQSIKNKCSKRKD